MSEIDPRRFRTACGQFMTGVTIVTTLDAAGSPAGLTANSFTSVSLHPPLVLVCLGRDSLTIEAFEAGNGFAIHVLAADQQPLAQRFSTKGIERFEGVDWSPGWGGIPVVSGALAVFECVPVATHDGGDHVIQVGEVRAMAFEEADTPALGYFRGRYVISP